MSRSTRSAIVISIVALACVCVIGPRAYRRYALRIPILREFEWDRVIGRRKAEIAAMPWQDSRPIYAFAGDSHVEFGNWDQFCGDNFVIRNCGRGMAKIQDVENLVTAIPDRKVWSVVLMCGINNLGAGEPPGSCARKYEKLLAAVRDSTHAQKIIVLAVMPVRESLGNPRSRVINENVFHLNGQLKNLCAKTGALFLDLNGAIAPLDGGLGAEFTIDGLHLNAKGYAKIGPILCEFLNQNRPAPAAK